MSQNPNFILQVGRFKPEERLPEKLSIGAGIEAVVEHVESVDALEEVLDRHEASALIVGADHHGLEALALAKSRLKSRPVVMITGRDEPGALTEAIRHGLDDYVVRYESWDQSWSVLEVILQRWLQSAPASPTDYVATTEVPRRPELQAQAFWAFFDAAPVGIKILDTKNRILYSNPKLQNMLGYSEEEMRVLEENDLIEEEDRAVAERSFESLLCGEVDFSEVVVRHITHEGERIWTTLGRIGLRDEDGEPKYVLETIVDMSQPRQEPSTEGGPPVRRAFMGELASGIAHDLRNILSLIALDSEIVREAHNDQQDQSALVSSLERIIDAAKRGNRIAERINQIGKKDGTWGTIELCGYTEEFGQILRSMVPHSVQLEVHCATESVEITASPSHIDQILLNLVRNAADAMVEQGKIVVEALYETLDQERKDARPSLGPGNYAVIRVRDDGHGMDEETRQRIFEPYFTTKTGGDGTGLGLVNVFRATLELNGGVVVESEQGAGTTFSVYLPVAQPPQ